MQRERGVGVDSVPCSDVGIKRGIISPSDIEALIRPDTKAIVCTHASNLTGNVVDIKHVCIRWLLYPDGLKQMCIRDSGFSARTIDFGISSAFASIRRRWKTICVELIQLSLIHI